CLWVGNETCIPPGDQDIYVLSYIDGRIANIAGEEINERVLRNARASNLTAYNISKKLIVIERNP
ncbi:MAG: hypothetical protein QXL47_01215, partial [Candidatus Anstonellales archaeon]